MRMRFAIALAAILFAATDGLGQGIVTPRLPQDVNKQSGSNPLTPLPNALPVSAIGIKASIDGQVATVRVEHLFRNDSDEVLEGTYYFPVPEGATLVEFAVYDGDQRRLGRVKEKEEARAAYRAAVGGGEDPAILELTRRGWFESHVYPIPPHSDKRIEIIYSHILPVKDNIVTFDYPLGRGYKKLKLPVGTVEIELDLRSDTAIKNLFSPTHPLDIHFDGDRHAKAKVTTSGGGDAENFQLIYSLSDDDLGMSLLTYRKEGEDGYFLLMLSPKVEFDSKRISAKDVLFVIDVSFSMQGEKFRQAKEALRFGLTNTLAEGDRFNIIAFGGNITAMEQRLIRATPANIARALDFVDRLNLMSATNINDALVTAMKMFEKGARPQNLVFITDGQPTASITDPDLIVANTRAANIANARLFTFGVGKDVNRILLERLAAENRGAKSSIEDQSQLGRVVTSFFSQVSQPVLSDLQLDFGPLQVDRVHPAELPDLYTRSQIKIAGRYRNPEDLRDTIIRLTGQMSEHTRQFDFSGLNFPLVATEKEFLPKLWATERVGALLAQIRLYGERPELKQEVVELAREFNLVTPYTSMYVPTTAEIEREKQKADLNLQVQEAGKNPAIQSQQSGDAAGPGTGGGTGSGKGSGTSGSQLQLHASLQAPPASQAAQTQLSQVPLNSRNYSSLASLSPGAPGAVVDQNGAAIPGATVTLKDQNTGATRTVTTDSAGNYSTAGLPPGNYTVAVEAPGFKKTEVTNVVVQPGQVAATKVELSVGSVAETVMVTAVAPAIDTTASHLTSNYESRKLRDLPSLAPVDSFARLAPGITAQGMNEISRRSIGTNRDAEFQLQILGGRPRSNNFTLDGRDNNAIDGRPVISMNNLDAAETLHVMTTRGSGDVSFTGASSINIITRAGTNDFHGTLFDYHLNRRLGALSPLERRSGLRRAPKLTNTILGGTLGGPIRRDRIFFFGAFQAESETARRFVDSTASLLTPTERGLRELARIFPASRTVNDLARRGPLANTLGQPQVARTFLIPVLRAPIEFAEVTRTIPSSSEGYEAGAKFDFIATRRDTIKVSYWYDGRSTTSSIGNLAAGFVDDTSARSQLGSFRWNRAISPRTANEFGVAVSRARLSLNSGLETIPSAPNGVDVIKETPTINIGFRGLSYGQSPLLPASHASTLFEVSDALTHIVSRHHIKLGGQVRRRLTDFDYLPGRGGHFTYASFEDFVNDRPAALTVSSGDPRSRFTETHHHYFIDDAWRLRSNLTLSLGLSYENAGQPINDLADRLRERESNPRTALFAASAPLEARTIARVDRDNNNFAPRFGFAYTPRLRVLGRDIFGYDKTVIRGGINVSFDQTAYRPLADVAASAPNILLAVLTPGAGTPPSFPNVPGDADLRSMFGKEPRKLARTELAKDLRTPYSVVWQLTASRDFSEKLLLEASYAGSRGIGLIRAVDATAFTPAASGPLRVYSSAGRSTYHSLQARADIRMRDNLNAGLAYTLSKLIDDVPDNGLMIAGGIGDASSLASPVHQTFAQNPSDISSGERALSSFDRRHTLVGHFVWTLPFRRNQSGFVGRLMGGWQASGIITLASGSPFTPLQHLGYWPAQFAAVFSDRLGALRPFAGNPSAPADWVAFSNAANSLYRFFLNADGTPFQSPTGFIVADRTGFRAGSPNGARFIYNDYAVEQMARALGLAPDAFGQTFAAGRAFGDLGRNRLIGPRVSNVDFALLKTTKLNEKVSLQFRAEFFNLFNHPNRSKPNAILENAGGYGFLDPGETDSTPRRIRLGLKLIF